MDGKAMPTFPINLYINGFRGHFYGDGNNRHTEIDTSGHFILCYSLLKIDSLNYSAPLSLSRHNSQHNE